ncbi:MAG: regulatory iron-sulfur-containing complex subunit RicT [Bacteroidales bacterium]
MIGSCGRELCCSSHMKNFISITTSHARYQELSLNPQKLAGQCSKLKCCLNYELDCYVDKQKNFPPKEIPLDLLDGRAYFVKVEIYKGVYWYSFDPNSQVNLTAVPVERVAEIQKMNRKGEKPVKLVENEFVTKSVNDFENMVGQESITRFESKKSSHGRRRNKRRPPRNDNKR